MAEITHLIAENLGTTPPGLVELAGLKSETALPSVTEAEARLHSLKGTKHVIDIRNIGLVGAVELQMRPGMPNARAFETFLRCFEKGVLVRQAGDIIELAPALIIEVAGQRFALPQTSVVEAVSLGKNYKDLIQNVQNALVLKLREEVIPAVELRNSIVAGNSAAAGANCSGAPAPAGPNLQWPGGSCGAGVPSQDPLLTPLADNTGPSLTYGLHAGSPALDAGDPASCVGSDQRGVARPAGAGCDIGALEQGTIFLVTTTENSGVGSLRAAISAANDSRSAGPPDPHATSSR